MPEAMAVAFSWEGIPILDIEQWAADRGDRMVEVTYGVNDYNVHTGTITEHEETMVMPETFHRTSCVADRYRHELRWRYV
jgi:hypothetical protein